MSVTRKCIVLDLDNILWGGIIGEDGIKGLGVNMNRQFMMQNRKE